MFMKEYSKRLFKFPFRYNERILKLKFHCFFRYEYRIDIVYSVHSTDGYYCAIQIWLVSRKELGSSLIFLLLPVERIFTGIDQFGPKIVLSGSRCPSGLRTLHLTILIGHITCACFRGSRRDNPLNHSLFSHYCVSYCSGIRLW